MGVWQYILNRLALTIPMIFVLLTLIFIILRVMPGDTCLAMLGGRNITEERLEECREKLGLKDPLHIQYVKYLGRIVRGDFGESVRTGRPVLQEIFEKFPATLELALFGMLVAILLGLLSGVLGATHSDRALDHAMRVFNIGAFSMPIFWIGLMFLILFAVKWKFFPVSGRLDPGVEFEEITGIYVLDSLIRRDWDVLIDALKHLALPAFTLGLVLSGFIGRMTRANMLEVLDKEYVQTARAKGLKEHRVIYKHALRNALIPIVTVVGLQFALLMAGAILTETIYSWPGMARYLLVSIEARDFQAIQGTVVFIAIFISTVNLLVDVAYSFLDPRVRY